VQGGLARQKTYPVRERSSKKTGLVESSKNSTRGNFQSTPPDSGRFYESRIARVKHWKHSNYLPIKCPVEIWPYSSLHVWTMANSRCHACKAVPLANYVPPQTSPYTLSILFLLVVGQNLTTAARDRALFSRKTRAALMAAWINSQHSWLLSFLHCTTRATGWQVDRSTRAAASAAAAVTTRLPFSVNTTFPYCHHFPTTTCSHHHLHDTR
jgi:hypothetical protein